MQQHCFGRVVTAAFEDFDTHTVRGAVQLQTQRSGRCCRGGSFRPEYEGHGILALCRQLQPSQGGKAYLFRPRQYDTLGYIPQSLFTGPQGFIPPTGAYQ